MDVIQHLGNVAFRRGFAAALDLAERRSGSQSGALVLGGDDEPVAPLPQERVGLIEVDEPHLRTER